MRAIKKIQKKIKEKAIKIEKRQKARKKEKGKKNLMKEKENKWGQNNGRRIMKERKTER